MLDPKSASIGDVLFLLRRIFNLSENATVQDIVAALLALEAQPETLTALSALLPSRPESDTEKISRLLQVTPEMMRRWAA